MDKNLAGGSIEVKKLPTTPPPGSKDRVVGAMEATVEGKPQELRLIRPYYESYLNIPSALSGEAQIVMHGLFSCFDKQGSVKEGKVKDLVWGFNVSMIEPDCTYKGLADLHREGYLEFADDCGSILTPATSDLPECFVKYKAKMLTLVYM